MAVSVSTRIMETVSHLMNGNQNLPPLPPPAELPYCRALQTYVHTDAN